MSSEIQCFAAKNPANRLRDYDSLTSGWAELCVRYLPIYPNQSIWRYSREALTRDPEQGWKLHISATVTSAIPIMQRVAPFLTRRNVLYKAPLSLDEVAKLNAGIFYGYSQVGKVLTIYPQSTAEACILSKELHKLTKGMMAPRVPFDLKYRPDSCVHYRYGAFKALEKEGDNGDRVYFIRDPDGHAIPDQRESASIPVWVTDPFLPKRAQARASSTETLIQTRFKAFRALAQRGKGGVYLALDLGVTPYRPCILKEGRKHGEVDWHGRDGCWRIKHEERVMTALSKAGINVPQIYSSFHAEDNHYLATEFVEGENLEEYLIRRKRRLVMSAAIKRSFELSALISRVHAAGWVWRDCKPRNIIVTRAGLRPLDFEGACPVNQPDPTPWGTFPYLAPEATAEFRGRSQLPEDLYALGVVIYLLLSGRTPDNPSSVSIIKSRRNIPRSLAELVRELLHSNPRRRPQAATVARRLALILGRLNQRNHQGTSPIRRARTANRGSGRKSS
jgi:hypothetical protein